MPFLKLQGQGLFKFCIAVQCHVCSMPCILWIKKAHHKQIFNHFSGWVKTQQIPPVIFETKTQFFFKL